MWRFFQGPTSADRVVAADTLSVIVTAGLAWLAMSLQNPLYLDVALVYGALAFVGVVALARAMEGPR
jgi:multisubunit Na+/H+ antiporter MnhF subunit